MHFALTNKQWKEKETRKNYLLIKFMKNGNKSKFQIGRSRQSHIYNMNAYT